MTHLLAEVDDPVVLADIRQDLFSALPHLRAFAISLTGDVDRADDLVQEAVVRGLSHLHQFKRGTNFQGWMFTGDGKAIVGTSRIVQHEAGFHAVRVED